MATTMTGGSVRPNAAVYRRRRSVAALAIVAATSAVALGAHGVLTGPGGVPASAAGAGTAPAARVVRAAPGDSLWALAERHHGEVDLARYVEALIDLNGATSIASGQLVRLP